MGFVQVTPFMRASVEPYAPVLMALKLEPIRKLLGRNSVEIPDIPKLATPVGIW